MKDFIYLDTDAVSSISAQLFEGNILELIDEQTENKGENITDSFGTDEKKTTGAKAGLPGASLDGKNENQTSERKAIEFLNNETFKIGVKKVYDDFLYNKVYDVLEKEGNILDSSQANLYDFIKIEGEYEFYDINTIGNFFSGDLLFRLSFYDEAENYFPEIEDIKKNVNTAKNILNKNKSTKNTIFNNKVEAENYLDNYEAAKLFKGLGTLTSHIKNYLRDKVILIKDNQILIGDKNNLRIDPEALILISSVSVEGLGRVLKTDLTIDGRNIMSNSATALHKVVNKGLPELILSITSPILGLEKDTYDIIHPIGLEFSKVSR